MHLEQLFASFLPKPDKARGAVRAGGPMADGLLEAVRGLHLAHPELGPKPLLAKLHGLMWWPQNL